MSSASSSCSSCCVRTCARAASLTANCARPPPPPPPSAAACCCCCPGPGPAPPPSCRCRAGLPPSAAAAGAAVTKRSAEELPGAPPAAASPPATAAAASAPATRRQNAGSCRERGGRLRVSQRRAGGAAPACPTRAQPPPTSCSHLGRPQLPPQPADVLLVGRQHVGAGRLRRRRLQIVQQIAQGVHVLGWRKKGVVRGGGLGGQIRGGGGGCGERGAMGAPFKAPPAGGRAQPALQSAPSCSTMRRPKPAPPTAWNLGSVCHGAAAPGASLAPCSRARAPHWCSRRRKRISSWLGPGGGSSGSSALPSPAIVSAAAAGPGRGARADRLDWRGGACMFGGFAVGLRM
jgi:hypothetical protein